MRREGGRDARRAIWVGTQIANAARAMMKAERTLEGAHVLVIEDDPDILELHVLALRNAGATVDAFDAAQPALDALTKGTRFDAIVSDIALPGMDGFELMRRARALGGAVARIPALAVTALGEEDHVDEAARVGFHAHVRKPLAPDDLVLAVACLVPPRRAARRPLEAR